METDEINRVMRADKLTEKFYAGCYASDQIDEIEPMKIYILNLDKCKCKSL